MLNPTLDQSILAKWRESYGWWNDEPYREVTKTLDGKGKVHRKEKNGPPLGQTLKSGQSQTPEDHTQDWSLKERKVRDVKAAEAQGRLPHQYYDRQIQERHAAYPAPATTTNLTYAPLRCISGYAFGQSVILAEELPALAAAAGCTAAALTDHFSLSGAFEFAKAGKRHGIKTIIGTTVTLPDGGKIALLSQNQTGYRNLCRLITTCHLEEPRGYPIATFDRLARHAKTRNPFNAKKFVTNSASYTSTRIGTSSRMFIAFIAAQLAIGGARALEVGRPAPTKPTVTEVWRTNAPGTFLGYPEAPCEGVSIDGKAAYFSGANGIVGVLIATGEPTSEKLHPMENYRVSSYGGPGNEKTVKVGKEEMLVIWDSPTLRVGYIYGDSYRLCFCAPGTTKELYTSAFPGGLDFDGFAGRPDNEVWALKEFSTTPQAEMQGNDNEVDLLFLPNLKKSPLNVNLVYDVSQPDKVLGELFPKGMTTEQAWNLRLTPHTGLICGNAYTGKVRWKNKNYTEGYWANGFVVASHKIKFSILSGTTGQVVLDQMPFLTGSYGAPKLLGTSGPYVLMLLPMKYGNGQLVCIKIGH